MAARPAVLRSIWQSEKGLSAMLVLLCLALFVGVPLSATTRSGELLFDVLFSLLLVSGVVTVGRRKLLTALVSALTLATLAVRWAAFQSPSSALWPWAQALTIALLSILTALVLVQVFRQGPITGYRIQGSIVVYLLIGLIWVAAYEMLLRVVPDAFVFAKGGAAEAQAAHSLVYFSFITLTTVGYGDITPLHPAARSLAMAEGLIGQLYPAILIARLVAMELEARRRT